MAVSMLGAALLAGYYAVQASSWAVMTDELQTAKLATSIADHLSPIPRIHGAYYGALSQLYPLLLAPLYGTLTPPAAETAAHGLNALLLASTAWPVYLLARSVSGSRGAGYAAAALAVFTPWLALASTQLTENAAYPAFVWAVYFCQRTLSAPSPRRDAVAAAGLVLAYFARTQLFVLALALPLALVVHEGGLAVARRRESGDSARGWSDVLRDHRLLVGLYLLGAWVLAALATIGSLGSVVGNYSASFRGSPLPAGFWHAAVLHLDQVAIGVGAVPLALAASWCLTALLRPERKEAHAFAALLLVLVPLLMLEATSFDLRFTPGQFVQDRYLGYLAPLLAVGSAAWLSLRSHRVLRAFGLVVAAGGVAALLLFGDYGRAVIFWAAPAGAFGTALEAVADQLGLSTAAFLALVTFLLALALAGAPWFAVRGALVGTALALAALGAFEAGYVLHRYGEPVMTRASVAATRNWIDETVHGRSVALVPSPGDSPVPWWEAEFWNKDVDRVLRVGSGTTFTPFPADSVSVDYARGRLRGPVPTSYLVLSPNELRFQLRSAITLAEDGSLRLVAARPPYRLSWATLGLTPDGWLRPLGLATLRLYGQGQPLRHTVVVTLAAPRTAVGPVHFVVRGGGNLVFGAVDPGGARPPLELGVCVPAHGYVNVSLVSDGRTRIEDGRLVALHLDRLQVGDDGRCG